MQSLLILSLASIAPTNSSQMATGTPERMYNVFLQLKSILEAMYPCIGIAAGVQAYMY